jgi:hypothetical protein
MHCSGILHGTRKNIILGLNKTEKSLQNPKTEFGAQNQYGRVQGRTGTMDIGT